MDGTFETSRMVELNLLTNNSRVNFSFSNVVRDEDILSMRCKRQVSRKLGRSREGLCALALDHQNRQ